MPTYREPKSSIGIQKAEKNMKEGNGPGRPGIRPRGGKASALDAVYRVLADVGGPLAISEITKRVLERRLWQTTSRTPKASIAARISVDMDTRGDRSPFVRVSPGVYAIRH